MSESRRRSTKRENEFIKRRRFTRTTYTTAQREFAVSCMREFFSDDNPRSFSEVCCKCCKCDVGEYFFSKVAQWLITQHQWSGQRGHLRIQLQGWWRNACGRQPFQHKMKQTIKPHEDSEVALVISAKGYIQEMSTFEHHWKSLIEARHHYAGKFNTPPPRFLVINLRLGKCIFS